MADGSVTMAVDGNITKDEVYRAVAPTDFESMLELDRYNNRSTAFDKIISATHDHFWDPLDKNYIDFDEPFDMENEALLPEDMFAVLQTDYGKEMLADPKTRIRFINASHAALVLLDPARRAGRAALSASLCHILRRSRARRNTPPTRRAKKRATSPPSPSTSRRAGAARCRAARRCRTC